MLFLHQADKGKPRETWGRKTTDLNCLTPKRPEDTLWAHKDERTVDGDTVAELPK